MIILRHFISIIGCLALLEIFPCPICRALFERRKEKRHEKERGSFTCSCGHILARWKGFVVPTFKLLAESPLLPKMPPENAIVPPVAATLETFTTEELIELFQQVNGRIGESLNSKQRGRIG